MAQIPNLQSTNTLGVDDQAILRQGTIDKRIGLNLAGILSWARRNGYNHLGEHTTGIQFPDTESFTTFQGKVYFVNEGVSLPYSATSNDPSNDANLYNKDKKYEEDAAKIERWKEEGDVRGWGAISGEDATLAFTSALSEKEEVFAKSGEVYLVGDVSVTGKKVTGGATIKKVASAESAFHLLGEGSQISGMVFDAESVSGQPKTDIKLGDGAKNCQISGNTFKSPIYSAISGAVDSLQGGVPYLDMVSGVTITDNVFRSGEGKYARPVYLHSVENITIYGNIFRDCNFDAIRLRENDGYCIIDTNQFIDIGDPSWIDNQTRDAVDVYWGGAALTISNNIVRNTAFAAFDIKGISDAAINKTRRVIITGNQIEKTRFNAIYIAGDLAHTTGDNVYIDSINISNNIIEAAGQDPSGAHGIYLENMAKYVTISENMVLSCFGRGIYAHNSDQSKDIVKSLSVCDNICVNNGLQSNQVQTEAGINLQAIDGLLVRGNICENDTEMDNPYQASGIFLQSVAGVFAPEKTALITGNICRNNTVSQISTESNGSRANNIAAFRDNLQVGTGALQRQWHDQRTVMHGSSAPSAGDGEFRKGDVIWNVSPVAGGFAGWICVTDGTPGTWQTFGNIST